MTHPAASATDVFGQSAQAFGKAMGEMWKSMSAASLPQQTLNALQGDYLKEATTLWNSVCQQAAAPGDGEPAAIRDRRFAGREWMGNPAAAYVAQMYLLNARTMLQMADNVEADEKTKGRIRFAVQQWIDAVSPSNFLALNPEVIRKAIDTQGESIAQGMNLLLKDIQQGHVSQTDESMFEVGRNVATSEGSVVFENELFQLIEYKPLTAKVHERPMLFVPPCINKYYILDLQPENSVIRYTVEQGHRVFVRAGAIPMTRWPPPPGTNTSNKARSRRSRWCGRSPSRMRSMRWAFASAARSSAPRSRCWPPAASSR